MCPSASSPSSFSDTIAKVLAAADRQRSHFRLMGCIMRSQYTFVLNNDYTLFRPLVAYLQESSMHMGLGDAADRTRLGVALEEALANALYHGNLEVDSALKEEDEVAYQALVAERARRPPYCERRIHVDARLSREEAVFVIRDEGIGFDPTALPDPTDPANLEKASGRGILLMRAFMDEVAFNTAGNQVTLIAAAHATGADERICPRKSSASCPARSIRRSPRPCASGFPAGPGRRSQSLLKSRRVMLSGNLCVDGGAAAELQDVVKILPHPGPAAPGRRSASAISTPRWWSWRSRPA